MSSAQLPIGRDGYLCMMLVVWLSVLGINSFFSDNPIRSLGAISAVELF